MTATLARIEVGLTDLRSRYQQAAGQLALLESQKQSTIKNLASAKNDIDVWTQVQALFGKVSEFAREQLKQKIQDTVTAALQAVFERDDISFEIEIRTINNQPAASWQVVSLYGDTAVSGDPESSRGGGISDVVSLALRLALLELSRPRPQGAIMLDEVGKHISRNFAPNVAQFLKQYAQKTGRQVLLITHDPNLAEVADVSYRVSQVTGISEVERI